MGVFAGSGDFFLFLPLADTVVIAVDCCSVPIFCGCWVCGWVVGEVDEVAIVWGLVVGTVDSVGTVVRDGVDGVDTGVDGVVRDEAVLDIGVNSVNAGDDGWSVGI